jgi:pimeloyl-ACP methyl ester carboxylesterase
MKKIIPLTILTLLLIPAFIVAARSDNGPTKPSIVLVHGAWADGSSWSKVIRILQDEGYTVYAPPNPLRGMTSDSAYIASFLSTISGPIILVGHSYGGAVITNAAAGNSNVKALVYVDAFAPDQGESLQDLSTAPAPSGQPNSCLAGPPTSVFSFVPIPSTPGDFDLFVKPSLFPSCFANDLSAKQGAVLAATQRPFLLSGLPIKSGAPAWKSIQSWYALGTLDKVIPPWAQMFMAQRAQSHIVQVRGGHLCMISQPDEVAGVIERAAQSVQGNSDSELTLAPTIV